MTGILETYNECFQLPGVLLIGLTKGHLMNWQVSVIIEKKIGMRRRSSSSESSHHHHSQKRQKISSPAYLTDMLLLSILPLYSCVLHCSHLLALKLLLHSRITSRSTVGWNWMKSTHSIHRHKSLSYELRSEWVSDRANEWAQRSARTKRAVRSKRMSERCKRMSERRCEWPRTLRIDFIVILPNVRPALLSLASSLSCKQWRFGGKVCPLTMTANDTLIRSWLVSPTNGIKNGMEWNDKRRE